MSQPSRHLNQTREIGLLALLILIGLAQRISLLAVYPDLWFCSDEANLGIMALRLVQDGKPYIFIAAETYGGTLGVLVIALFALITNSPFLAVKIWALLNFVLFAVVLYLLGKRLFEKWVALVAVALVCFAPAFLTVIGSRQRGPHGEFLVLGTLLLWWTLSVADKRHPDSWRWAAWGILAGFNWYTYYLSIVYIAPAFLFLVTKTILHGRQKPFRRSLFRRLLVMGAGFFVGSGPYWLFVLKYGVLPPFNNPNDFFDPLLGLQNFFFRGVPVITGGRWSFSPEDFLPILGKMVLLLYLVAVLYFVLDYFRSREFLGWRFLFLLFLTTYPLIYAFSSFAWVAEDPRYLAGLYSVLPLVLAWFFEKVWRSTYQKVVPLLILIVLGVSSYGSMTIPPHIFNTIYNEPNDKVMEFLEKREIHHFYANYWIVYRLMFESVPSTLEKPELMGSVCFATGPQRHPDWARPVFDDPEAAYITWLSEAPLFESALLELGRSYKKKELDRYVVFHEITPPIEADHFVWKKLLPAE